MNHQQLRELVHEHFAKLVAKAEARINDEGPLSDIMQQQCQETIELLRDESIFGRQWFEQEAGEFIEQYDLQIDRASAAAEKLGRLITQGRRSYLEAAVGYSHAAETFDFKPAAAGAGKNLEPNPLSIEQLVGEFWKYAKREDRWTDKTEKQKQEHIDLLYERLGRDFPARTIGRKQAHLMRDTLVAYPANRNKSRATKGKPLLEILDLPGVPRLHNRTINKYLHTYNGMFNWAVQNGHCEANPFNGLSLRTKQADDEAPRLPFSDADLNTITNAVLAGSIGQKEHHKWGTLLAIHTGARLTASPTARHPRA